MAGAEYVRHVRGDKLKAGDVLVFRDYYTVLGPRRGYVERTDPYSGEKTRQRVTFAVERFRRDGTGRLVTVESFSLGVSFPLGRLV